MKNLIIAIAAIITLASCGNNVKMKVESANFSLSTIEYPHPDTIEVIDREYFNGEHTAVVINGVSYHGTIIK